MAKVSGCIETYGQDYGLKSHPLKTMMQSRSSPQLEDSPLSVKTPSMYRLFHSIFQFFRDESTINQNRSLDLG